MPALLANFTQAIWNILVLVITFHSSSLSPLVFWNGTLVTGVVSWRNGLSLCLSWREWMLKSYSTIRELQCSPDCPSRDIHVHLLSCVWCYKEKGRWSFSCSHYQSVSSPLIIDYDINLNAGQRLTWSPEVLQTFLSLLILFPALQLINLKPYLGHRIQILGPMYVCTCNCLVFVHWNPHFITYFLTCSPSHAIMFGEGYICPCPT